MRKTRLIFTVALVLCAAALCSCDYNLQQVMYRDSSVENRVTGLSASTLTGSAVPTVGGTYKVAVITDVHFGAGKDRGTLDDTFVQWVGDNGIGFVICLGDVAEHGAESEYQQYASFVRKIEAKLPSGNRVYSAVGNHDLFSNGWAQWKKYVNNNSDFSLDTSFYTFEAGGFSWYFIDTGSGTMGTSQYKALKARMEVDSNKKIVLSHYPLYSDGAHLANYFTLQNSMETSRLITLCAQNNVVLFASGHTHRWAEKDFGPFREINYTGFLSKEGWGLLTVDAASHTVSSSKIAAGDL